ncbi:M20/M25/M40 family metallo-hydrolase [Brevibacterium samyangense]
MSAHRIPAARARTAALTATTALALAGASALVASPASAAPADSTLGVTGDAAMAHLSELAAISEAHADSGYRALGTPGYEAASTYVEDTLEATGAFDVTRQEFSVDTQEFGTLSLTVDGTAFTTLEGISNGEGTSEPLTGVPVTVPADEAYGDGAGPELGCTPEDFTAAQAGTIVLLERGVCAFGDKITNATAAGAAAVLIANNEEGPLNATAGDRIEGNAPSAGLQMAEGDALLEQILAAGDAGLTADLTVESTYRTVETWNVLAETKEGDPEDVQMLGAHLDGVPEGPGVNDNASGVAGLLAVAEGIAGAGEPVDNRVRLGFWGAEEVGLVGSTEYVAGLSEDELGRISAYLNFDMIGSENYVVGTLDSDGSDVPIPEGVNVPEGSAALEAVFTDYFDGIGQPHVGTEFSGRSDYQAFIDNGIPVSGLFSGADDIKTEEQVALFGGVAGVQQDRYYHTIDDTLAHVNEEAIDIFVPAMAHAASTLAFDPDPVLAVSSDRLSVAELKLSGIDATLTGAQPGSEVTWELIAAKTGEAAASGSGSVADDGAATIRVGSLDARAAKGLPGDYTLEVTVGHDVLTADVRISGSGK